MACSGLVMRVLSDSPQRLVASPGFLRGVQAPVGPASLANWPTGQLAKPGLGAGARPHLAPRRPRRRDCQVSHRPRFVTDDMTALRQAALRGIGIVQLPWMVVEDDLRRGDLIDALPGWAAKGGVVHAVIPSRRGVLPAVRLLIGHLAARIEQF